MKKLTLLAVLLAAAFVVPAEASRVGRPPFIITTITTEAPPVSPK